MNVILKKPFQSETKRSLFTEKKIKESTYIYKLQNKKYLGYHNSLKLWLCGVVGFLFCLLNRKIEYPDLGKLRICNDKIKVCHID